MNAENTSNFANLDIIIASIRHGSIKPDENWLITRPTQSDKYYIVQSNGAESSALRSVQNLDEHEALNGRSPDHIAIQMDDLRPSARAELEHLLRTTQKRYSHRF